MDWKGKMDLKKKLVCVSVCLFTGAAEATDEMPAMR